MKIRNNLNNVWSGIRGIFYLFEYTGTKQDVILTSSKYIIRVWGAQGGHFENESAGLGAYTEAIFRFKTQTRLNVYVGSEGQCANKVLPSTFFQSGRNAIGSNKFQSCTGGGSTFISVNNNISDVLIASGSGGGSGNWTCLLYTSPSPRD